MIANPDKDLTLAFSGIFQSAILVYQLAKKDQYDHGALWECANSLLRLDADTTEAVYGSWHGVDLGLRTMIRMLGSKPQAEDKDVYQYIVSIHQLSSRLRRLDKTSQLIHEELREIGDNLDSTSGSEDSREVVFESLAGLYSRTISYLTPRIIVQGSSERLQDPETVNRVRTALFAGIRSAYLWHQRGGRKWQLLFNRKGYVAVARQIIAY